MKCYVCKSISYKPTPGHKYFSATPVRTVRRHLYLRVLLLINTTKPIRLDDLIDLYYDILLGGCQTFKR